LDIKYINGTCAKDATKPATKLPCRRNETLLARKTHYFYVSHDGYPNPEYISAPANIHCGSAGIIGGPGPTNIYIPADAYSSATRLSA
jgi:hypothetical protein